MYFFFLYIFFLFLVKSPVLAAAPDIQYPFSPHFPAKFPYFTQNYPQLGEILQNTPIFTPQNP